MIIKTWSEHKAEMNKQDSKETTIILSGCFFLFALVFAYLFLGG